MTRTATLPRAARRVTACTLVAAAAVAALAAPAAAQQETQDAFQWSGRVEPGRVLYVRNLNGAINVERGGSELEITARKRWRRGNPDDVRVELQRVGGGDVLVCGVWVGGNCDVENYRSRRDNRGWDRGQDTDVSVEFTVRVPEGVRLDLSSVNGAVDVEGATADVHARTVNGRIRAASLGGPVTARTVNGGIEVAMGRVGREDLSFETVNGSITIVAPRDLGATLLFSTVNGSIDSDFPLTVQGRMDRRRIEAVIGNGGPRLEARTVNGGVTLRRGS